MVCEKTSVSEFTSDGVTGVKIENVPLFDVNKIFDCGQCFRFDPVENSRHQAEFLGYALDKYISVAQDGECVYIYNTSIDEYESKWKSYLAADTDYGQINEDILSLSDNENLKSAVKKSSGIRILRQDGWEALCSFIISQNNNIPRIKKLIAALCAECDEDPEQAARLKENMGPHMSSVHKNLPGALSPFPSPERVKSLGTDVLLALKFGFRAKYLYDTSCRVCDRYIDLESLYEEDTEKCVEQLCSLRGVGPKVASCTLLFGFGHLDAFPIDVWIKKVLEKYFDKTFSPSSLGRYAGVAQQYLFYYERYLDGDGRA